jgi:hypothetical protein
MEHSTDDIQHNGSRRDQRRQAAFLWIESVPSFKPMTIINKTHRFIFIHIPKTGGTSVKEQLRQYRTASDLYINHPADTQGFASARAVKIRKHSSAIEVRTALGAAEFSRFFKFCAVRNPFSRTISLFRFLKFNFRAWPRSDVMEKMDSLEEFVASPIFRSRGPGGIISPQVHWLVDESGANCMDFIVRTETIEHDFRQIKARLGLPEAAAPLLKRNQSKGEAEEFAAELVSGTVVDAIRSRYAADFRLLEYSKEPNEAVGMEYAQART